MWNVAIEIIIVLFVMLIFLGLRTGLVVASLIPIVTIMTLMLIGISWRTVKKWKPMLALMLVLSVQM